MCFYSSQERPVKDICDIQAQKGEADLKPLILRALEAMREKDVFKETTPDDLEITGMNFGWEITGTINVAIRVKGISLPKKPSLNLEVIDHALVAV